MANAYRDKYGILHVVEDRKTAEEFAHSEIVEYNGEHAGGYPQVNGLDIIDEGNGEIFVGGNKNNGTPLENCDSFIKESVKALLAEIGI